MPDRNRRLKLRAEDADDLAVISAALQDAVAKLGDIKFESKARRLTLALNRYRWETGGGARSRAALQIGSVQKVEARRLRRDAPDAVVELLAISFEPGEEPPEGVLLLQFAGGGDLRLSVECVDMILADISDPWPTTRRPKHD